LTEGQKKKIEVLLNCFREFNFEEIRYFTASLNEKQQKMAGIDLIKMNAGWPLSQGKTFSDQSNRSGLRDCFVFVQMNGL
jgi:hypothetical protein